MTANSTSVKWRGERTRKPGVQVLPRLASALAPPRIYAAGFSLIEVMVAVLILGIALVGLTTGITTALSSNKDSELQTTAALFAEGKIETLRAEGGIIDGEDDGDCGPALQLYRWKQTVAPSDVEGLHDVEVTVEHAQTGQAIYSLRTLLFEPPSDSEDKSRDSKSKKRSAGS